MARGEARSGVSTVRVQEEEAISNGSSCLLGQVLYVLRPFLVTTEEKKGLRLLRVQHERGHGRPACRLQNGHTSVPASSDSSNLTLHSVDGRY